MSGVNHNLTPEEIVVIERKREGWKKLFILTFTPDGCSICSYTTKVMHHFTKPEGMVLCDNCVPKRLKRAALSKVVVDILLEEPETRQPDCKDHCL